MAQVVNRKTGAVHGDPTPEKDIMWEGKYITTPSSRAPQITLKEAMILTENNPDLIITCRDGKWWHFGE